MLMSLFPHSNAHFIVQVSTNSEQFNVSDAWEMCLPLVSQVTKAKDGETGLWYCTQHASGGFCSHHAQQPARLAGLACAVMSTVSGIYLQQKGPVACIPKHFISCRRQVLAKAGACMSGITQLPLASQEAALDTTQDALFHSLLVLRLIFECVAGDALEGILHI